MLNERTRIIIDPVKKQKALVASAAVKLAKTLNDPLYEQYKMHKEKAMELKRKLIMKYAKSVIKKLKEKGVNVKITPQDLSK